MMSIESLIQTVDAEVIKLNYCEGNIRHYRECWNVLRKYMESQGTQHLTAPLAIRFLKDKYGIDLYAHEKITSYKLLMRRSVMLLLEYQASRMIYKRMPMRDHSFPPEYEEVCIAYLNHLREQRGLSTGSIRQHRRCLEHFTLYCTAHGITELSQIDIPDVHSYLKTLEGCSKSYVNTNIRQLKSFFIFLYESGMYQRDIHMCWPSVRVEHYCGLPETFTLEETQKLLAAVDRSNALGKRDYAILLLAVRYGLRVSDIRGLRFDNIDFKDCKLRIVQQKTRKPLEFELFEDVGWALIDYLKNGRPSASMGSHVFVRMKAPYSGFSDNDNLSQIIYKYALKAGIAQSRPRCSMHMFRYTLASTMLSNETPLPVVSSILGHSQLDTTKIYTKIDLPQLELCPLEVPHAK